MIDTQTIQQIMHTPSADRLYLAELILHSLRHEISPQTEAEKSSDNLMGLFADEPELIDQISESAMQARERDSLRWTR